MKKKVRYVDEDTLEIKEILVNEEEAEELDPMDITELFENALGCEPEEFEKKYKKFKKAEAEFNAIYEPFKANLLKLHEDREGLPKSVVVGCTKLTYVSPSTRNTIDSKKLKEEEPEIAKKYTKTTNVKPTIRMEEI